MKKLYVVLLSIFLGSLTSCVDEFEETQIIPGDIELPPIAVFTQASVKGTVIGDSDEPLNNVLVTVGNRETTTDGGGRFSLENVLMHPEEQTITFSRGSYFTTIKTFQVQIEADKNLLVRMKRRNQIGGFTNGDGGQVGDKDEVQLTFPPNSVSYPDGTTYEGDVRVYQALVSQDQDGFDLSVPGNLTAINEDGDEQLLESYSMAAIEIGTDTGDKLQIKEGSSVLASFPITSSMEFAAPESIDLWSLNETLGKWNHEGEAVKIGDRYEAELEHFTWWNCDVPRDYVKISMTIVDENGSPISNAIVRIRLENGFISAYDYTDSRGFICGLVPKGQTLEVLVYAGAKNCFPSVLMTLPPISDDTALGELEYTSDGQFRIFEGRIVDCDGNGVPNAELRFEMRNEITIVCDEEGYFKVSDIACPWGGTFFYQAYDPAKNIYESARLKTVSGLDDVDFGVIELCHEGSYMKNWGWACCINTMDVVAKLKPHPAGWDFPYVEIIAIDEDNGTEVLYAMDFDEGYQTIIPNIRDYEFDTNGFNASISTNAVDELEMVAFGLLGEEIFGRIYLEYIEEEPGIEYELEFRCVIEE